MIDKTVNVVLGKLSNFNPLSNKENLPGYEIILKDKFDASSLNPYILNINFRFNDTVFKKRLLNILKFKKHCILYDFSNINKGSLFRPSYELELFLKLETNNVDLNLIDFIVLDIFTLGLFSSLNDDYKIRVALKLNGLSFKFNSKDKFDLFKKDILILLNSFFEGHFNYYLSLCNLENRI